MTGQRSLFLLLVLVLLITPLLAGCSQPTPTPPPPTQAPAQATKVPPTPVPPTEVPPTKTPGPAVGGKIVFAIGADVETLDPHRISVSGWADCSALMGASLITRDLDGKYVGWLAESWTVSPDGLVYEFTLKNGVKFHDGTPLTAQDYVWTIERALDKNTKATQAATVFAPVAKAEAPDERTLRLTLKQPMFPFLYYLTWAGYSQPLSKAAVEAAGDRYGRQPVGVGPYKLAEIRTGERVVLTRNPDYNWGPDFLHKGPAYIETVEYRIITEKATTLAGLEAGEIDVAGLNANEVARIEATGKFQILENVKAALDPAVWFNVTRPPFDDVRVRQALNYAADREAIIKTVALGDAVPQYGVLSPAIAGYWPGIEQVGYKFDLEKAKALLQEAGYTPGADGILAKDGQPLEFEFRTVAIEPWSKVAQVLQEQYKAIGVETTIQTLEVGVWVSEAMKGNCDVAIFGMNNAEADILYSMFHSSNAGGGFNLSQVKDPELDRLLEATRSTVDPDARQKVVEQAETYIIEQAFVVPLYVSKGRLAVASRINGVRVSPVTFKVYYEDAYIESE